MGRVDVVLDDKLEEQFRKAVFETKGMKRGNISEALQEAVKLWIETRRQKKQ